MEKKNDFFAFSEIKSASQAANAKSIALLTYFSVLEDTINAKKPVHCGSSAKGNNESYHRKTPPARWGIIAFTVVVSC